MRPLHLHSLPVVVLDVPRREDIDRSHRIVIPATRAEPAQLFPGLVMRAHPSPKHGPGGGHGGPGAAGRRPRRRRVHGEDSVGRQVQVSKAARARAGPPAAADSGPAPGPWRIGRRAAIGSSGTGAVPGNGHYVRPGTRTKRFDPCSSFDSCYPHDVSGPGLQ